MLLTIEKVLILKGVAIFAETAEELLADIAYALATLDFDTDQLIVEKDDPAHCMYIIVDGRVKVHDKEQQIAELGSRDFFGELALLDDGLRVASVTTLEPTRLLRLERNDFHEILRNYPEVAQGIMRVLSQRLRGVISQSSGRAPVQSEED